MISNIKFFSYFQNLPSLSSNKLASGKPLWWNPFAFAIKSFPFQVSYSELKIVLKNIQVISFSATTATLS